MTDTDGRTPPPTPPTPAAPLLGYEPASPLPARLTARVVWWSLPAAAVLVVGAGLLLNPLIGESESLGMGLLGTPLMPVEISGSDTTTRRQYGLTVAAYLAVFVLTQWLFLFPRGRLTLRADGPGRPLRRAAVGAGFAGMLLTVGFVAVTLDVNRTWMWLMGDDVDDSGASDPRFLGVPGLRPLHLVWAGMLLAWLVWACVFYRFLRDADHRTGVGRVTKWLLAGTVLELLVAGPAHVWAVTRSGGEEDDCYCARGSYTGLVFGCTALLWLFGPGVFLLVVRERRRRERLVGEHLVSERSAESEQHQRPDGAAQGQPRALDRPQAGTSPGYTGQQTPPP